MQAKHFHPTVDEMADVVFDTTRVVELPLGPETGELPGWEVMERGSDEHIAFLEQIIAQLQATLVELKAARAARNS